MRVKFGCLKYPKLQMTFKAEIKREVNGEILKEPTQVIQFVTQGQGLPGYFETDDPKKIEFIKRHVDFGNGNIYIDEQDKIQEPSPEEEKIIAKEKKLGRPKKSE